MLWTETGAAAVPGRLTDSAGQLNGDGDAHPVSSPDRTRHGSLGCPRRGRAGGTWIGWPAFGGSQPILHRTCQMEANRMPREAGVGIAFASFALSLLAT